VIAQWFQLKEQFPIFTRVPGRSYFRSTASLLFQKINQHSKEQARESKKVECRTPSVFETDPTAEKESETPTHRNP
jgi:hypothetical protein